MKPDIDKDGAGKASPPDFNVIPVTLTFDGFVPFKFEFKRQQSKDVKEAKQAFYAQTEAEQEATLKSYRINILAGILLKKPVGVFGFPEIDDYVEGFKIYFNDPDNEELLQWVWSQYQAKLYPKELLSSPIE